MARKPRVLAEPQESPWLSLFLEFISALTIDSKESGVGPLTMYGSQRRFLAEVIEGLERDIHLFVCLKAMQLGVTTLGLAITLFWLAVHPGMQGVLVTDTDGNRQKFRVIIKRFLSSLPRRYKIQIKKGGDNREHMVFENGSVLDFLVAGTKSTATEVGRSRAYNVAYLTEAANYGAIEGIVSLIDRLAEKHPDRLYIIESTAKSFNLFYKLWNQARANPDTQKAFFIGWWAKDDYCIEESSPLFAKYWDGSLDIEEQEKVNQVWEKYGWRITPGQLAWYRWKSDVSAETSLMAQNFPWVEEDAFLNTGQSYFQPKRTIALINTLTDDPPPLLAYVYDFGNQFMDTKIQQVDYADDAHLKIYEEPSDLGWYAMGVDPAYGRSEHQDRSVVQVARCYADKLVQVAEFATSAPENYQVAWVMAHLAGIYRNIMMVIEITGPGDATVREVNHVRQLFDAGALPTPGDGSIEDIFGNARWFMYHRIDSPGAGFVYHWKGSLDSKISLLAEFSDSFTTGALEVRSVHCALEMQSMVRRGYMIEPAMDDQKDDRVFGLAYAHRAWAEWIRPMLITEGSTYERITQQELQRASGETDSMVASIVQNFFSSKQEEREEQEIDEQWE